MGASSSGLLDEARTNNIKGLVDSTFQGFSVYYRQQYTAAFARHLQQEVEPKKEGRGLLLTHGPHHAPEEMLYQGTVKFSCWDEQGKKSRDRYIILRREYKVEIHESLETYNRGCAAKLVLQPAGGSVFTTEESSKAHLEQTCAGILNGVKEDSSSVVSPLDVFAVYLHLPYMGHICFLFQKEEDRDHFLSALKLCIRHSNLDPWCDSSFQSQAFIRALQLYRQDKGNYESWEKLLGTEEQVLASQLMEEVLPWLQSQLQSRIKGKKTERIRHWLVTVHAAHAVVLEQLTASLEALREECGQAASTSQALIRSNLDQILSSHCFVEEKVRACVCAEAGKVCSEHVVPYLSSLLEALTENISAGIQGMRRTLHTQMDLAFTHTHGGTEETKKALSTLRSISLDECYKQVERLQEKLEGLEQRFGLSSTQRLVHSAHLEMEKLLESAVYTLQLFLQSSARLQPSQVPVKMDRAKERVLKQLDHDSRVVQRRLYEEALLEITLPSLTRKMDSQCKTELQQLEQYIFSDYSSFILVQNVYDDVLRDILRKEIETVVQDAASKKNNNLLLDTSDLAISQYSLLGHTPPRSAPDSPATYARDSTSAASVEDNKPPAVVDEGGGEGGEEGGEEEKVMAEICPPSDPEPPNVKLDPIVTEVPVQVPVAPSPAIVITQQADKSSIQEGSHDDQTQEEPSKTDSTVETSISAATHSHDSCTHDAPDDSEPTSPDLSVSLPLHAGASADCDQSDRCKTPEEPPTPDLSTSEQVTEDPFPVQSCCTSSSHPACVDDPVKISLGSLSEAVGCDPAVPPVTNVTDRAVYLTGVIKDNWEMERTKMEKEEKHKVVRERIQEGKEEAGTERGEGKKVEKEEEEERDGTKTGEQAIDNEDCCSSESPAEGTATLTSEQREREELVNRGEAGREQDVEERQEDKEVKQENKEKVEEDEEEEVLQSSQPMESQAESSDELPLDSISIIRDLVTEITEVETVISPCPKSCQRP